jgi:hypothetical protein
MLSQHELTFIGAVTGRDSSGHVTDAQIYSWLDLEVKNLRRYLADRVPEPFTKNTTTLTVSNAEITVPADWERTIRLERLVSGSGTTAIYTEIDVADPMRPQDGGTGFQFREEGTKLLITPADQAAAIQGYRLTYISTPTTIDGTGDAVDLPAGCEQIAILRVQSHVALRCKDPELAAIFTGMVEGNGVTPGLLKQQTAALKRRYGRHVRVGFTPTRSRRWRWI